MLSLWQHFTRRWLEVVFWWLPRRDEETGPKEQAPETRIDMARPASGPDHQENASHQPVAVEQPRPDDLTAIKGIGPAVEERLHALGIATFADLAAADADALTEELKDTIPMSNARAQSWIDAARERTRYGN